MGGIVKSVKKTVKGVGKIVKKVAKRVVKIGKSVIKGVGKLYNKTFGKLGPLGAIAASFILPGLGSMMSGMWTSAASSLAGSSSAFLQAMGQGMQSIGTFAGSISESIGKTFSKMGNSISEGAGNLFKGAQKVVNINKPLSFSEMGSKVVSEAQGFFKAEPSQFNLGLEDVKIGETPGFTGTPSEFNLGGVEQTSLLGDPTTSVARVGQEGAFDPKMFTGTGQPVPVDSSPFNLEGVENIQDVTGSQAALPTATPVAPESSFLNKIGKALAKQLNQKDPAQVAQVAQLPFFTSLPEQEENLLSQRGQFTGVGAGGGEFLTAAQKQFFEQERRRLGANV